MPTPDSTIRLLAPYRGRSIGSVITGLSYGAAQILVELRRLAEWAPGAEGYPLGSLPPTPKPQAPLPTPMASGGPRSAAKNRR